MERFQLSRDEFGRAVLRKGLSQQFMIGSCLTSILVLPSLVARRVGDESPSDSFFLLTMCIVFGGLFGLLLGIFHGLPVIPQAFCSCWPTECYTVTYYDKVHCPCLFSCTYCGEIHSRHVLLVVTLDDPFAFKRMLRGKLHDMPG